MGKYRIVDEPRVKPWAENLIVDPFIVLFVAIFLPIFWDPPFMGRFWMPLVWLLINGFALGSSTLAKEVIYSVAGLSAGVLMVGAVSVMVAQGIITVPTEQLTPFVRLALFGLFLFTLYSVVMRQSTSYQLFQYTQGSRK